MSPPSLRICWIGEREIPETLHAAAGGRWDVHAIPPGEVDSLSAENCILVLPFGEPDDWARRCRDRGFVLMRWTDNPSALPAGCLHAGPGTPPAELAGKLSAAGELLPWVQSLHAQGNGAGGDDGGEMDEQMRLASRLQQDFLPRRLPTVGPVQFSARLLSASFVSGDIYDVFRLDETHVGFYVVDAVGHGMPAALLTMFIKEALHTKRIHGHTYEIIPPHEVLEQLNADLCSQNLSMCEFCTALYGVLDTQSLRASLCRAGHPQPLRISADGEVEELALPGPLLGILDDALFESQDVDLHPGERLVLYSDGVEEALCGRDNSRSASMVHALSSLSGLGRTELLEHIETSVRETAVDDDATVLVVEVTARDAT